MPTLMQPAPPPAKPPHPTDPALRRLLAAAVAIFAVAAVLGGALVPLGLVARDTKIVNSTYRDVDALRVDSGS